ncbi:MAG: mismatch-specific DNA-glycosylase [Nitrospirales bacterium]|nr:mismatch-specific DNA-glycosylase [Nitrospira sp.]MDR4502453.1 mismatch-specific DNA-glycosylase [Nitrospirales bacterium]
MSGHLTLPDYIKSGLDIVFVGINPGVRSAVVGHHFAGHSNRFWKLLNDSRLLPCPVTYEDDWRLPSWGVGLTNIVSRTTSGSRDLLARDYSEGRQVLKQKIRRYRPAILALLGVTLYPIVFPQGMRSSQRSQNSDAPRRVGLLPERFENARVVLLPNPSGRNAHYSYSDMLKGFDELCRLKSELRRVNSVGGME